MIYCNKIIKCLKEFNQEKEREKNIYSHDKLDAISQRYNKILNKYSISELEHVYRTNFTLLENYILFVKKIIKEIQSKNKKINLGLLTDRLYTDDDDY